MAKQRDLLLFWCLRSGLRDLTPASHPQNGTLGQIKPIVQGDFLQ